MKMRRKEKKMREYIGMKDQNKQQTDLTIQLDEVNQFYD